MFERERGGGSAAGSHTGGAGSTTAGNTARAPCSAFSRPLRRRATKASAWQAGLRPPVISRSIQTSGFGSLRRLAAAASSACPTDAGPAGPVPPPLPPPPPSPSLPASPPPLGATAAPPPLLLPAASAALRSAAAPGAPAAALLLAAARALTLGHAWAGCCACRGIGATRPEQEQAVHHAPATNMRHQHARAPLHPTWPWRPRRARPGHRRRLHRRRPPPPQSLGCRRCRQSQTHGGS